MLNPEADWYRGDFHVHTNASDGAYPPSLVAGIAKAEGLDFVAITDHNTIDVGDYQSNFRWRSPCSRSP